jgi:hypothetical protein
LGVTINDHDAQSFERRGACACQANDSRTDNRKVERAGDGR